MSGTPTTFVSFLMLIVSAVSSCRAMNGLCCFGVLCVFCPFCLHVGVMKIWRVLNVL